MNAQQINALRAQTIADFEARAAEPRARLAGILDNEAYFVVGEAGTLCYDFDGNAYTNPRVCPIGTAPTFSRAQAKALARVTKDGADRTMRAVSIREHMANEADKLEALAANLRAIPDNV